MTEKKSKSNLHEAPEKEISTTEVEVDIEEVGTEIAATEMIDLTEMIEDPEEILATDQKDALTAVRKVISLRTANNVSLIINVARKPREFNNRDRNDRGNDRGGYKRRSRSRSEDRHRKHRRRSSSNSSRD